MTVLNAIAHQKLIEDAEIFLQKLRRSILVWTRGDDVRYEEPPLCEECASKITIGALLKWELEEEEEGGADRGHVSSARLVTARR